MAETSARARAVAWGPREPREGEEGAARCRRSLETTRGLRVSVASMLTDQRVARAREEGRGAGGEGDGQSLTNLAVPASPVPDETADSPPWCTGWPAAGGSLGGGAVDEEEEEAAMGGGLRCWARGREEGKARGGGARRATGRGRGDGASERERPGLGLGRREERVGWEDARVCGSPLRRSLVRALELGWRRERARERERSRRREETRRSVVSPADNTLTSPLATSRPRAVGLPPRPPSLSLARLATPGRRRPPSCSRGPKPPSAVPPPLSRQPALIRARTPLRFRNSVFDTSLCPLPLFKLPTSRVPSRVHRASPRVPRARRARPGRQRPSSCRPRPLWAWARRRRGACRAGASRAG